MAIEHFFMSAQSVFTLLSFLTFLGVVFWSYSSRRKPMLEQAAYLPFADDDEPESNTASMEKHHG